MEVRVNGENFGVPFQGLSKLADVVELIKSSIDPDHMITSITLDGRELEESDWLANPTQFGTSVFDIETGHPEEYVRHRLTNAHYLVQEIFMQFRDSRKNFSEGMNSEGNRLLGKAVQTFQAFIEWYGTIISLLPPEKQKDFDISPIVTELSQACQSLCQRQLTQSWIQLGDAIRNQLEPKLEQLEDQCRGFRQSSFS